MKKATFLSLFAMLFLSIQMFAQQPAIQYSRAYDQTGLNQFEPSKSMDQPEFTGLKVRIGGSFTENFQRYTSTNSTPIYARNGGSSSAKNDNKNNLYGYIKVEDTDTLNTEATLSGFNTAQANLNFDIQVGDGIRVFLENYMSARHHNEFWVKGGYIQIDKLPMFGSPEWYTKYVRVKVGHFMPNYGDFQFRRSDGGNTIFNPFCENLIVDAFTTEIGGEAYIFPAKGFMLMGGMSAGFINGNIIKTETANNQYGVVPTKRTPSIFGKVAYDNTFGDLRFRLSASVYNNPNISRNTLLAGDRTGSNYFGVMEPAYANGLPMSIGTSSTTNSGPNFTSGRFNPGMANRITAINVSPFIKWKFVELQGGYDIFKGANYADTSAREWVNRSFNQMYAELVLRFLPREQMFVGARYVAASGEASGVKYGATDQGHTAGEQANVSISRIAFAAGWFPTESLLLKFEYVTQQYKDFPRADYRYEGKFSGFMISAVVGF